ncbi:M4 family metallopeptidase [Frigoribacterium sp. VKM Ac-1396]|uniref:M4 family metallopeptidase n=1 Tax=Frigoribacterium sp. VKM Ac-1396 TaxID=2783821 RepID=UPI00188CD9D8|nr:M4 family metallopeptidase [Frigoribacterium sp. VKM Ac-1396]MBF4601526.1 M4 family metallopeptidase [Frigoribacterium sp. VKM Ac-1396]
MTRFIVPPYLLAHLAEADSPRLHRAPQAARNGLLAMRDVDRNATPPVVQGALGGEAVLERTIFDARGTEDLPGVRVRGEGEPATDDVAATEAYDALGATYALFREVYGRSSIDGAGLPLDATVHYGQDYDNAFWNGERMVFGDGDGEVFERFTASVSVIGHELTHGVTQYTANLTYQGQSGALNESVSDVFGALVEQHLFGQTADQATWLIGEGLFTPEVQGRALRSMKAPGTAYDDDVLGKDPQPGHLDDYVETTDDNGGVHLNSGIPNRAFYLVAEALGGEAWVRAGQIWYDTLTGGALPTEATFAQFATATVEAAATRYGAESDEARATSAGWQGVGVTPAA